MTVKHINNHIEGLTTETVTDIVQHCDEHTNTDEEFYKAFTQTIFDRFGWSYHIRDEAHDIVQQRAFEDYPKTELIASNRVKGSRDGYWEHNTISDKEAEKLK